MGGVIGGLFGELTVVGGLGLYPVSLMIERGKKIYTYVQYTLNLTRSYGNTYQECYSSRYETPDARNHG